MRQGSSILLFALLALFTSCSSSPSNSKPPLTIAGAANLRFALEALTHDFTQNTGIPTDIILASSGKLTAQIMAGAPYDIFLSADEQYPSTLASAGLTLTSPQAYAQGPLALWTATSNIPLHPDSLVLPRIKKIAIPNPATAPYGVVAMKYLQEAKLDSILAPKLVFGESVGQANQFVITGAAEIGFTALATAVRSEKFSRYQRLKQAQPVLQTGVIIKSSQQQDAAKAFMNYLLGEEGQITLQKFGYFAVE